jgi:NADH-quinone oxidoreductase subunit N
MITLSIASMVLGAFAALNQRNIKRIIAYSAIGNMGYALMGIAVASENGIKAALIYLVLYLIMIVGFFAALLTMIQRGRNIETIQDLSGLSRVHPGSAFVMAFVLFSMVGVPPLAGFFGKLYLFQAAVSARLYFLAIIGVVTSVVAATYYLIMIKALYMDELLVSYAPVRLTTRKEPTMAMVLAGVVISLILFFIQPGPVIDLAAQAAAVVFYP